MVQPTLIDMFDVRVPLANAPMAGVAGGRLAAAVSRAGGLGMIGIRGEAEHSWVNAQIDVVQRDERPFGVGMVL